MLINYLQKLTFVTLRDVHREPGLQLRAFECGKGTTGMHMAQFGDTHVSCFSSLCIGSLPESAK